MKRYIIFITLLFIVLSSPLVQATDSRFILFIMDGVSLAEIEEIKTPNLEQLITNGAVGLMNMRTAGELEPDDSYLTIGAGTRARVDKGGYLNFNLTEEYQGTKVRDIYIRRVGHLNTEADIVNLRLKSIRDANQSSSYQAEIGHLTTLLNQANLDVAVLGNADIWNQARRQVALIGINKYGIVKQGDVGQKMYRQTDQYPSGYITDHDYLMKQFNKFFDTSDLLVVESGDTSRIEAVRQLLTTKKFKQAKKKAIKRVDRLLGLIVKELDFNKDYLLVVIPTPASGNKLTLATLVGPTIKDGLLTSGSTRRTGLITSLDIAPTIYYSLINSNKGQFTGRGMTSVKSDKGLDYLSQLNNKIKRTFKWRPIVVKGFILLQIITLGLVAFIFIYNRDNNLLERISIYLLISLLWIPSCFLLSSYFLDQNIYFAISSWLIISLFLAHYTIQQENKLLPFLVPTLVITTLLTFDLWRGADWTKLSVLGYSPVIGARFYGIGNEFMGVLIGAGIIGLTGLQELKERLVNKHMLILFILLVLTVGYPKAGANFGGVITATLACSVTYFNLKGYNFDWKILLKISLVLLGTVLIIILIDFYGGLKTNTHLAHTLVVIKEEGISELLVIISRKLQMNLKLLRWTIWSRVLLAFVIILIILFKWPQGKIRDLIINYPSLAAGFRGSIVGSTVTMLVNDSGVVAAATLLLFPIFTLLYIVLVSKKN
ncbi:hypothetical protein Halha_2066 [Halobacteroides halobius DSM 5150]|uniref:Uncharacterized protein n=1 Tax=Halobacteroides halobius (strain ATCC 35273 / DSM 5150 / MD-1) TaxID=748449 RepID=L0KBN7_HALHC|nr:hypothetical protein [Halobacteroides halobius]AGB41960.1 hypothetical protein Halha_2066 [Halobacteroides halobius DSM 5150]